MLKSAHTQVFDPSLFHDEPIVVDAGARYGDFGLPFFEMYPSSFIVCVDPMQNKRLIEKIGEKNKSHFEIIPKLLWYKKTMLDFYVWDMPQDSVFPTPPSKNMPPERNINYKRKEQIETITLGEIFDKYGYIDLLKMNIEGAEFRIIERTPVAVLIGIPQITMEVHCGYKEEFSLEYMMKLLDVMGFDAKVISSFAWEQHIVYAKRRGL